MSVKSKKNLFGFVNQMDRMADRSSESETREKGWAFK